MDLQNSGISNKKFTVKYYIRKSIDSHIIRKKLRNFQKKTLVCGW